MFSTAEGPAVLLRKDKLKRTKALLIYRLYKCALKLKGNGEIFDVDMEREAF